MSELNTQPTEARRAEIAERLKAATGGPWQDKYGDYKLSNECTEIIGNVDCDADDEGRPRPTYTAVCVIEDTDDHDANAAFIEHSHADVQWLLAELSRLTAELARQTEMVPEGYVLVPVEPTVAMMKATWHVMRANKSEDEYICDIYRAMIAARPTPAASDDWCAGRDAAVNWLTWLANHSEDDRKADLLGCAKRIGALIRPTPADSEEGKP